MAARHYLQATGEHFQNALENTAHNTAQSGLGHDDDAQERPAPPEEPSTDNCRQYYTSVQIAEEGLEPPTRGL